MRYWAATLSLVFLAGLYLSGCITIVADRCRDSKTGQFVACEHGEK